MRIELTSVTKSFNNRKSIFKPVTVIMNMLDIVAITGDNGSGKSTLLKVIAKVLQPSSGSCTWYKNNTLFSEDEIHPYLGFSAPYLNLYDEFTAIEHCKLNCKLLGVNYNTDMVDALFNSFGLTKRKNDGIKTFSSGMKQRMKLILALQHQPSVLLLDEPTTNLDTVGIDSLYTVLESIQKDNRLIVLATNEQRDIDICTSILPIISTD